MDTVFIQSIATKPDEEFDRDSFPSGFPDPIDVPVGRYNDPDFFALEQAKVFSKSWQYAGHTGQMPNKGDYIRLDAYKEPLFLMRGDDGVVRCFYNSCQHRGAALITEPSGNKGTVVCPYHAWTYGRQGDLRGYPEAKNYPRNADKNCLALKSVRCETYGPLIFFNLDPGAPSLRDSLGTVADEIDALIGDKSEGVYFCAERTTWINANWKFAVDANAETYHVPYVHKNSAASRIETERTGQWLLPKGHSRMLIKYNAETKAMMQEMVKHIPGFKGIASNALPMEGIYSFHLFPGVSIVLGGPNMWFVIADIPHAPDRTAYFVQYFSSVEPSEAWNEIIKEMVARVTTVLAEDLTLMEGQQASVASGGIQKFKLQYQERRIRRLHEDLDLMIGKENIPEHLRVEPLLTDYIETR